MLLFIKVSLSQHVTPKSVNHRDQKYRNPEAGFNFLTFKLDDFSEYSLLVIFLNSCLEMPSSSNGAKAQTGLGLLNS